MVTLLVLMATNDMNVVLIIFALNVLDSKTPIPAAMVGVEDMVGVAMVVVKAMLNVEEAIMVPVTI